MTFGFRSPPWASSPALSLLQTFADSKHRFEVAAMQTLELTVEACCCLIHRPTATQGSWIEIGGAGDQSRSLRARLCCEVKPPLIFPAKSLSFGYDRTCAGSGGSERSFRVLGFWVQPDCCGPRCGAGPSLHPSRSVERIRLIRRIRVH